MFLRKFACLAVLIIAAVILSGCTSDIVYKGSYFSKFGPAQLKASVTTGGTPVVGQPTYFSGMTTRQIPITTVPVQTNVRGCVEVPANWPPNVYQINAVSSIFLGDDQSFPSALTIVGAFSKGVFAGGLLKVDSYLAGGAVRKLVTPREITFGVQHPECAPSTKTTVAPAFLLFDNDHPIEPISLTAVDFEAIRVSADGDLVAVRFKGVCYIARNFGNSLPGYFEAVLTPSGGGVWNFEITVKDLSYCVIYVIPPTRIDKGGVILRPEEL